MKTLTKHQIAGNKFHFFMVCDTVLQSNEHQTEACTFGVHTFPLKKQLLLLYVFFRLFSAVLNKSRH